MMTANSTSAGAVKCWFNTLPSIGHFLAAPASSQLQGSCYCHLAQAEAWLLQQQPDMHSSSSSNSNAPLWKTVMTMMTRRS